MRTVVTREVEWDDLERDKMLALDMHDSDVHAGGCGFHDSLATDVNNLFEPFERVCPLCAQVEQQDRVKAAEDKRAQERAGENDAQALPSDGRRRGLRMLSEAEAAERRKALSVTPVRPSARRIRSA